MSDYDRTVHATTSSGGEVVRYERSGRYALEYPDMKLIPMKRLRLSEAVAIALRPDSRPHLGRAGGMRFDAAVRRAQAVTRRLSGDDDSGPTSAAHEVPDPGSGSPFHYTCPKCQAEPRQRCRTAAGRSTDTHQQRWALVSLRGGETR